MSEIRALLPELWSAYEGAFGVPPPRRFREAYWRLCAALYGWDRVGPDPHERQSYGKRSHSPWPFEGDWRLLALKARADTVLASLASAIRGWERRREAKSGQRSRSDHRADLARTGGARREGRAG